MYKQHFFILEPYQLQQIEKLFKEKINNSYVILTQSKGYCDIAQYSDKFQTVKLICVREENLSLELELK